MTGDSPTLKTPPLLRVQALIFLMAAIWSLFDLQRGDTVWWTLGIATFLLATASLCWNIGRIGSTAHGVWPRRVVIVADLVALAMFLGSILANQQVVPSVVFGSASLGMALLIGKLPALVAEKPAA